MREICSSRFANLNRNNDCAGTLTSIILRVYAHIGFEGLTTDSDGTTLYALLQSATIQDGGNKKKNARHARLLAYNISDPSQFRPSLVGEWVVPLPLDADSKTLGASELHFVSPGMFLVLARDGGGHGGDETLSAYKCVLCFPSEFHFHFQYHFKVWMIAGFSKFLFSFLFHLLAFLIFDLR